MRGSVGSDLGLDPRNCLAVLEAGTEFHVHVNCSVCTADEADQVGVVTADGHEVGDYDRSPGRLRDGGR